MKSVGDERLLEAWDEWSKKSPKYEPGVCAQKWQSFGESSQITIRTLVYLAKQDGWQSPFNSQPQGIGENRNSNSKASGGDPTSESLRDLVLKILQQDHSPSKRQAAFLGLARTQKVQLRDIERLADSIEAEVDLTDSREDRAAKLADILEKTSSKFDLHRVFHPYLAIPLERVAQVAGADPAALGTVLLTASCTLVNPKSRIVVKLESRFLEPFILYSGIVGVSGSGKSHQVEIIVEPLKQLQWDEEERHKKIMAAYEAAVEAAKASGEKLPKRPDPPREFFVDNATTEALDKIKGQQQDHGFLIVKDELSAQFGNYNAYRSGRGSDREIFLSGWNGKGVKLHRVNGARVAIPVDATSIVGGIQPDVLEQLMGDFQDASGEWARFLFVQIPLKPHYMTEDDRQCVIVDLLRGIYQKIDALPATQFRFSREARKLFVKAFNQIEDRKCAEARAGLRGAISKMARYIPRLAGIMHILWEVAAGNEVNPEIPVERVQVAIELVEFYLDQTMQIYRDNDAGKGELSAVLSKILEKAYQFGEIDTRTAKRAIWALRSAKATVVMGHFKELVALGYGTWKNRVFVPRSLDGTPPSSAKKTHGGKNVDEIVEDLSRFVDEIVEDSETPETTVWVGLQTLDTEIVKNVEKFVDGEFTAPIEESDEGCTGATNSCDGHGYVESGDDLGDGELSQIGSDLEICTTAPAPNPSGTGFGTNRGKVSAKGGGRDDVEESSTTSTTSKKTAVTVTQSGFEYVGNSSIKPRQNLDKFSQGQSDPSVVVDGQAISPQPKVAPNEQKEPTNECNGSRGTSIYMSESGDPKKSPVDGVEGNPATEFEPNDAVQTPNGAGVVRGFWEDKICVWDLKRLVIEEYEPSELKLLRKRL